MIKISDLEVGSCENVSPDWPSPIRVLRCLRNIVSNGTFDCVTLTLSDDKPETFRVSQRYLGHSECCSSRTVFI